MRQAVAAVKRTHRVRGPVALVSGLVLLVLGAARCGAPRAPSDPENTVIASIDGEPVYLVELDRYLAVNLLGEGNVGGTADLRRVKSRLLDGLIDERLQLAEAERRGIEVSEREIEAQLDTEDAEETEDETADSALGKRAVRQRMMIRRLQEQVADELGPIEEDDVLAYLEHEESARPAGRRLVLRSLLFDSAPEAERAHRSIRKRQITFDEAVAAHRKDPSQGVPLEVSLDGLPAKLRDALRELDPGDVAPPLEIHGATYLFQVVSWPDQEEIARKRQARARRELEVQRLQGSAAALIQELRAEARIRLLHENLPFLYIPND